MITTTLNRIRKYSSSETQWTNLLAGLGKTEADDEPLPFAKILEINGLDRALWCCPAEPQYAKEWRLLMVAYARRVEHLCTDPAVKNAIDVAERYANGKATDEELNAASDAASAVASAAASAVASDAASAVASAAARAVASAAARVVAAWEDERKWQAQEFLRVVTETEARA